MSANPRPRKLQLLLTAVLFVTVLDTAYLSWRFIALQAGWVEPGTGICSWTANIDCDRVLLTPDARAFYVPNAVVGFAFFFGCLIWWTAGSRLGPEYRYHVIRTLVFWLVVGVLFTFRFFWLLVHLDVLCPLCPWNHVLTYIALAVSLMMWRTTPRPSGSLPSKPLIKLVVVCVVQFWIWPVLWLIAHWKGWI
ncbi:MAG TPA: vitamin K epoxide reductase family protein [Pyrinomonadaceae bacterium]|nr:vitamin K epoxide reductase family protein [Pyrinomonadaceae bacterium]